MQPIGDILSFNKVSKARNEREYILQQILDEINKERVGTKYKEYSFIAIKQKLAHIQEVSDLYYIKSCGLDYKKRKGSFSKYFFGVLKTHDSRGNDNQKKQRAR